MKDKSAISHALKSNIIFLLIIVLIVYVLLSTISYDNFSDTLQSSIRRTIIYRAAENADNVKIEVDSFEKIIEGIALNSDIKSMDWVKQRPVLLNECERLGIESFQISDTAGISYSTDGKAIDIFNSSYFKEANNGVTVLTDPFKKTPEKEEIMLCITPIYDKYEKVIGILIATLNPNYLFETAETRRVGMTGYSFIVNRNCRIISNKADEIILQQQLSEYETSKKSKNETDTLNNLINRMSLGEIGYGEYSIYDTDKFMAYAPITNTDWSLAITVPKNELFYELNALKNRFIISMSISIVFIVLFSIILYYYRTERKKSQILKENMLRNEHLLKESVELDKLRTEFFANISHELRTPLNVILSTLQLLNMLMKKNSQLEEYTLRKHLNVMKQNSLRLIRLINNLIDTTKIDSGFFESNIKNYNIVSIVEEITLSVADFISNKEILLEFDTDVEEKLVACDADMIERIMLNLLSNAIKFTDRKGKIYVNIHDKDQYISISVKDTGIGIPEDKLDLLFRRFRQVDKSLKRNHEGSGIGLSLVKSLVELHSGKVSVSSTLGEGTEFVVDLPANIISDADNKYEKSTVPNTNYYVERIRVEFSDIYTI
jgi:Signal transduction histidine kinase